VFVLTDIDKKFGFLFAKIIRFRKKLLFYLRQGLTIDKNISIIKYRKGEVTYFH
jgi:hypothetical protein